MAFIGEEALSVVAARTEEPPEVAGEPLVEAVEMMEELFHEGSNESNGCGINPAFGLNFHSGLHPKSLLSIIPIITSPCTSRQRAFTRVWFGHWPVMIHTQESCFCFKRAAHPTCRMMSTILCWRLFILAVLLGDFRLLPVHVAQHRV